MVGHVCLFPARVRASLSCLCSLEGAGDIEGTGDTFCRISVYGSDERHLSYTMRYAMIRESYAAGHGMARRGEARYGAARRGMEWLGAAGHGMARWGTAGRLWSGGWQASGFEPPAPTPRPGQASTARLGRAWRGTAGQGPVWQGRARTAGWLAGTGVRAPGTHAWQGAAWRGGARRGEVWHGMARRGLARLGREIVVG